MKDKEMSRLGYATWRRQYHNFLIRTFGTFGRADSFLGIYGRKAAIFSKFLRGGDAAAGAELPRRPVRRSWQTGGVANSRAVW